MVREKTNAIIEACETGLLDWETVARCALDYLSEDDVADMARVNELLPEEEEEDEEEEEQEIGENPPSNDEVVVLAHKIAKYLDLEYSEFDLLIHDLNNGRGNEYLEWFEDELSSELFEEFTNFISYTKREE